MLFAGAAQVAAFTPANDYVLLLLPSLLLAGVSMPGLFIPPQRALLNAVRPSQQGEAGGISMSMQQRGLYDDQDLRRRLHRNAVVVGAVLVIALLAIERQSAVQTQKA